MFPICVKEKFNFVPGTLKTFYFHVSGHQVKQSIDSIKMYKNHIRVSFNAKMLVCILGSHNLIIRENCRVFSYPGYTETKKTQLVKNSH